MCAHSLGSFTKSIMCCVLAISQLCVCCTRTRSVYSCWWCWCVFIYNDHTRSLCVPHKKFNLNECVVASRFIFNVMVMLCFRHTTRIISDWDSTIEIPRCTNKVRTAIWHHLTFYETESLGEWMSNSDCDCEREWNGKRFNIQL